MHAMLLEKIGDKLKYVELPIPTASPNEILIKVHACGICRTDLHVVDGDLKYPKLPIIPGHQIVGTATKLGKQVKNFHVGQRVGVPWLGSSCGHCSYCESARENLCDAAGYTGYQINGGFAEYCVADARMSDIPSFPYEILWGERTLCSVANLTRLDGEEFLALAPQIPIKTEVHTYPLKKANKALDDLRNGRFTGAGVIENKKQDALSN